MAIIYWTHPKLNTVYEVQIQKICNIVRICSIINPIYGSVYANEILTNIPASFRPTDNYAYQVCTNNIIIQVNPNGDLGLADISATMPDNWYYPLNLVYMIY